MDGAVNMLLLLLTTLSCAPLVATAPRPPVTVMPVLAATVATDTADVVVSEACFPLRVVMTLTPPQVKLPFSMAAPSTWSSRVAMTSRP